MMLLWMLSGVTTWKNSCAAILVIDFRIPLKRVAHGSHIRSYKSVPRRPRFIFKMKQEGITVHGQPAN